MKTRTQASVLRQGTVLCLDNLKRTVGESQPFLLVVDKIGLVGYNSFEDITSFNGQSIIYDAIGNPTTYKGNALAWTHVRRLASYGANTFEYGADGIRTKKNGISYVLDGNKILRETDGASRNITYYYGTTGVVGFNYNGTDYYYRKNLQGDVIAIYTASGAPVAEYVYDAWGKVTVIDLSAENIGTLNPFRYRSYYYDTETGLYYLNSRYYDPETGRFINADDVQYLDPETLGGLSLYAYCLNNPVNMADPCGCFAISALIIGALIGAAFGFLGTLAADYADDGKVFNGSIKANGYIANTLVGAVVGSILGGIGSSTISIPYPILEVIQIAGGPTEILISSGTATINGASVLVGIGSIAGIATLFSKPNSGRIRFSDGTGIDPDTGKPVDLKERAYEIYKNLKDNIQKANWRKWMKSKGWRTNHLK